MHYIAKYTVTTISYCYDTFQVAISKECPGGRGMFSFFRECIKYAGSGAVIVRLRLLFFMYSGMVNW